MKVSKVVHLGEPGSFSHEACLEFAPELEPIGRPTFKSVIAFLDEFSDAVAMIPIDNSHVGRVPDVYRLLPEANVSIKAEFFLRVRHMLLSVPGSSPDQVQRVLSHPMALSQCSAALSQLGADQVAVDSSSYAAKKVGEQNSPTIAAIGSLGAARLYGLQPILEDIQDSHSNFTRFILLGRGPHNTRKSAAPHLSTILFEVKSIPSVLFKVLGGFATNGINVTKLESYFNDGNFEVAKFYCDFEGCMSDENVKRALEEVRFYSKDVRLLGTYPSSDFRDRLVK